MYLIKKNLKVLLNPHRAELSIRGCDTLLYVPMPLLESIINKLHLLNKKVSVSSDILVGHVTTLQNKSGLSKYLMVHK